MGLFSCCTKDTKSVALDAEARHARLVQIYQTAKAETQTSLQAPPAYNEVVVDVPTIRIDEKPIEPEQPQSPASSPRTSVISVPSTRLTDITSEYTDRASVRLGNRGGLDSQRSSLAFDSAPPSYYDGRSDASIRTRSRSPHNLRFAEENLLQQHPVMNPDWLNELTRAANRE